MLARLRQVDITKYIPKPLETGLTKEVLNTLKRREDTEDIKSQTLEEKVIEPNTYTQESLPESKMETCRDKLNTLTKNIQITTLSKILEADLTSKDKVSEKYWNSYSKGISQKLLFHHAIDLAGLEQESSSSGCSNTSGQNLRYLRTETMQTQTKSCQKTYWKLLQSSPLATTEEESIQQITRKIRIYPNEAQAKLFAKCFGAHNYFYNKAIESLRTNSKQNIQDFRKQFIPRDTQLKDDNIWMKEIPLDTREEAAKKALHAQKTCFSQLKTGLIKKFKLNFRSRKIHTPVFYVAKMALINGAIFSRRLKENKYLISKKDKEAIKQSDGIFSITREKNGRYYINIVIRSEERPLEAKKNICALDPGVRTFQTMYSQKSIGEFGMNTSKRLIQIYKREDKLKSILATKKLTAKKRYKLKKRCALLRTKVKHIVSDLHWKTADMLTKNFQAILLPIFNSKNMANKKNRKISKTSTRLLLGLSHYAFQQKLLYKAEARGRNVILCKEHYTTKCCGSCGKLNETIGSKKIFKCDGCGLIMDRDIHAARNILIRALSLYYQ
jgi:putative transposase